MKKSSIATLVYLMAGVERIELPSKVLETPMLPLYHTPGTRKIIPKEIEIINKYVALYHKTSIKYIELCHFTGYFTGQN